MLIIQPIHPLHTLCLIDIPIKSLRLFDYSLRQILQMSGLLPKSEVGKLPNQGEDNDIRGNSQAFFSEQEAHCLWLVQHHTGYNSASSSRLPPRLQLDYHIYKKIIKRFSTITCSNSLALRRQSQRSYHVWCHTLLALADAHERSYSVYCDG